jgi:hypothetical protein
MLPFGLRACTDSLGPPMADATVHGEMETSVQRRVEDGAISGAGLRHEMGGEQAVAKQKYAPLANL